MERNVKKYPINQQTSDIVGVTNGTEQKQTRGPTHFYKCNLFDCKA